MPLLKYVGPDGKDLTALFNADRVPPAGEPVIVGGQKYIVADDAVVTEVITPSKSSEPTCSRTVVNLRQQTPRQQLNG